jgi:hypothetical protein
VTEWSFSELRAVIGFSRLLIVLKSYFNFRPVVGCNLLNKGMAYCSQLCDAPPGANLVVVTEMANLDCLSRLPDIFVSVSSTEFLS